MKVAALDLGSNSFLCLIAENKVEFNNHFNAVIDKVHIVRLGEGVDKNKVFSADALNRAKKALEDFKKIIVDNHVDFVQAVATSAARDVTNADQLVKICDTLNIPVKILSGTEEAEMSFKGAVFDQPHDQKILVIDIGGGSTEFIFGINNKILNRKSLDIGGVRYFERFINGYPLTNEKLKKMEEQISYELESLFLGVNLKEYTSNLKILAVAGTPTSLAAAELGGYDEQKVHGYNLTLSQLISWRDKLASSDLNEKIKLGIEEKRADIILVGVCVLKLTLEKLKINAVCVSTKGLRYGLAMKLFEANQ